MDPICEICKTRHHPRQAHRFEEVTPRSMVERVVAESASNTGTPTVSHMANGTPMANKKDVSHTVSHTYRYRDPEKRKAYQRELMKKRRKKVP